MKKIDNLLQDGITLHQANRLDEAEIIYKEILELDNSNTTSLTLLGTLLLQKNLYVESIAVLEKSINLEKNQFLAYQNLGISLTKQNKFEESLIYFNQAIKLNPNYYHTYNEKGGALYKLHKLHAAIQSYDKALKINPNYSEAYNNLGNVYLDLLNYEQAFYNYSQALKYKPNYLDAYKNLGSLFVKMSMYKEALASYDKAINLKPDSSEIYLMTAKIYNQLEQFDKSLASLIKAKEIDASLEDLYGLCINKKLNMCQWDQFDIEITQLLSKIKDHKKVTPPFSMLNFSDDPKLQKIVAELYVKEELKPSNPFLDYRNNTKLRIGYLSADFYNHAVMHLMMEVFENHNKNLFEIFAFSIGPGIKDSWTDRAMIAFDKFIDCSNKSNIEIANLIYKNNIDILIDLQGHTLNNRMQLLSLRPAPIQVNFLGYPGTSGSPYLDYIIADKVLIQNNEFEYYSEKVAFLPVCYMPNMSERNFSEKIYKRNDFNLPENALILCSFNNQYKISPDIFNIWMNILKSVESSVLWIWTNNDIANKNLCKEAEKRGVNSNRLIFASKMPIIEEHLKRIQLADLFLDTFPYNAHTTASDALRVGLPIVTLAGRSFASRVCSSLLTDLDMPELIAYSKEEYQNIILDLISNTKKLKLIKDKLIANVATKPLFNSKIYTTHLESLYKKMHTRFISNQKPDHIY